MSEILYPEDETALAAALREAKGPLQIMGGGTRPIGRIAPAQALSTRRLQGITLYEPGAMTLVAKTGTAVEEIEAVLAAENQRLAFEPMDHRAILGTSGQPTLGGVIAANVSGPRRIQVGAARDFALGVTFVDGTGQVLSNGGRVMKNVTGYDLVKLMSGSWGTLGVLTEVALKVLPVSETQVTLKVHVTTWADAVGCMSAALGTPFDVSGAATVQAAEGGFDSLIRIEGFETSVQYRASELTQRLAKFGTVDVVGDPWAEVKDLRAWAALDTVWRISVRPTDSLKVIELMQDLQQDRGFHCQLDWGGGLLWLGLEAAQMADTRAGLALHQALQRHVAQLRGHATLVTSGLLRDQELCHFQPLERAIERVSQSLREKFDPRGILNPGRMR
ncbi:MAG: FAD-binding protein [Planktomarina sp.]|jgi:glycolate oxidase FAD binding subunit|uniref:FAD-binding protein n=1 Tax=Planktomarina sp. TaxID=2024851 RepID=UPI0032607DB0|nr:FAD-binding protein [Planktomarina sp.]